MISLPQGLKIGAPEAVDSRFVLTKAEMKTIRDTIMPDFYFAVCKDDSNLYIYNKANEVDEETGRFRLYAASSSDVTEENSEPIDIAKIQGLFNKEEDI